MGKDGARHLGGREMRKQTRERQESGPELVGGDREGKRETTKRKDEEEEIGNGVTKSQTRLSTHTIDAEDAGGAPSTSAHPRSCLCAPAPGGVPKVSSGPWRKLGKRREERAGHPRHPSGTPSVSHLPCLGLSPVARSPPGDPVRSPLRELTLGHAELVVVLQPVAGRAAAVAPALLLQAVVGAAAVFRRAVGEAHLWADTEGAARAPRLYAMQETWV